VLGGFEVSEKYQRTFWRKGGVIPPLHPYVLAQKWYRFGAQGPVSCENIGRQQKPRPSERAGSPPCVTIWPYLTLTTFFAAQSITVICPIRETTIGNSKIVQLCGIISYG